MSRGPTTPTGSRDPKALAPDAPADAAFRWLARTAEARFQSEDPSGEALSEPPPWRRCGQVARQFAQWSRQLPPFLQGQVTAQDVAVAFDVIREGAPDEEEERQTQRAAYRQMGLLLEEAGIGPRGHILLAASLWSAFEHRAFGMAVEALRDQGKSAKDVPAARITHQTALGLREHLIHDLRDLNMMGAAWLLQTIDRDKAEAAGPPG